MAQLLVRRDTIGQGSHVVSVRRWCRGPSAALLSHPPNERSVRQDAGDRRPAAGADDNYFRSSPKTVTVPVALSTLWHEVHVPFAAVNFALFRLIFCIPVRNGAGVGPFVWHRAHCCTVLAAEAGCPLIAFAVASRAGCLPGAP